MQLFVIKYNKIVTYMHAPTLQDMDSLIWNNDLVRNEKSCDTRKIRRTRYGKSF